MKWFEGSIPEAVYESKTKKLLFVVFIAGEDDLSTAMSSTWEDPAVSQACDQAGCVAVKLEAKSEMCSQFSQIYPVVCVPCTYFIGDEGAPLEVVGGSLEPEAFIQKINNASQLHRTQLSSKVSITQGTTPPDLSGGSAAAEAVPTAEEVSDIELKKRRAEEVIAKKRQERLERQKEEERKKELERIKLGHDMNKLKQFKREREQKEIQEQIQRDKAEEKKARERVRQQIAQDRADRAAKFQKEKTDREKSLQDRKDAAAMAAEEAEAQAEASKSEFARLQFRLPDGSAITNKFESSQTLGEARKFLLQNVGSHLDAVTLSTIYPKQVFTENNMAETLLDLQLAPSAVIIVLPGSNTVVHRQTVGSDWISYIFAPVLVIWNFLYNLLFGRPDEPRGAYNPGPSTLPPFSL